jgi:hypothetical protein
MTTEPLIHQLTAMLVRAYASLPREEFEGELGDNIRQTLEWVRQYLYAQASREQQATIARLAQLPRDKPPGRGSRPR